jgi:hypothetical protein
MKLSNLVSLTIIATVLCLFGCDELNNQPSSPPNKSAKPAATQKESRVPVHRFVLARGDGGVAFDTQTGQICRTWSWQPMGKPEKPDSEGNTPQRQFGEFAPTCIYIYQQYPSGTSFESESLPEEQPTN